MPLQESFALPRSEGARLQQALQHVGKWLPHDCHSLRGRGAAALAALAARAPDGPGGAQRGTRLAVEPWMAGGEEEAAEVQCRPRGKRGERGELRCAYSALRSAGCGDGPCARDSEAHEAGELSAGVRVQLGELQCLGGGEGGMARCSNPRERGGGRVGERQGAHGWRWACGRRREI